MSALEINKKALVGGISAVAIGGAVAIYHQLPAADKPNLQFPPADRPLLSRPVSFEEVQIPQGLALVVPAGSPGALATRALHDAKDRGIFVLDRRSNPPRIYSGENKNGTSQR